MVRPRRTDNPLTRRTNRTQKPTGDSRAIKTYAKLDNERRACEDRLKKVKSKIEEVEPRVMDFFQKMGLDRLTVSGVTVYVHRQLWACLE